MHQIFLSRAHRFFFFSRLHWFILVSIANKTHDAILGTRIRFPMSAQTASEAQSHKSVICAKSGALPSNAHIKLDPQSVTVTCAHIYLQKENV